MSERFQKQELDSNDHKGVKKGAKGGRLLAGLLAFGAFARTAGPRIIKVIVKTK